jgi:hypothetical protein
MTALYAVMMNIINHNQINSHFTINYKNLEINKTLFLKEFLKNYIIEKITIAQNSQKNYHNPIQYPNE